KGWLLPALGILTVILTGYSLFLGPAILRQDLRQDLANADILKMYPLRGWQVVLGELLAPAAILTGVQWCLVLLAAATFSRFPEDSPIPLSTRLSLGAAVAIDRKSTRLNSSHEWNSYAVFCLKKKHNPRERHHTHSAPC